LDIIRGGMALLLDVFLIMIFYFVISAPLALIFDGFDDIEDSGSGDEMNIFLPGIEKALNIAFAVALGSVVTLFLLRLFEREPDWRFYKQ